MDKVLGTVIVLLLIALAVVGMFLSWRRQKKQASRFQVLIPKNFHITAGEQVASFRAVYVATTFANDPLVRVAFPGLAFRAQAEIAVCSNGLLLIPAGEKSTFIPADQLLQIHSATTAIGKTVEKDGLTALSWFASDTQNNQLVEVTSYLRFPNPQDQKECEQFLTNLSESAQKGASA